MHSYSCCSIGTRQAKNVKGLSHLLKLVSDHSRLQLLCLLQSGEHCVCELTKPLSLSQSLTSHHLKDLKNAGLVSNRKDGPRSYYSLTKKGLEITNLLFKIKL